MEKFIEVSRMAIVHDQSQSRVLLAAELVRRLAGLGDRATPLNLYRAKNEHKTSRETCP
jgi:hypothetical protein